MAYFPGEFVYNQLNPDSQRRLKMFGEGKKPRWLFGLDRAVGPVEFKDGMAYLTHPCVANRINHTGGEAKLGAKNVVFTLVMNHMALMAGRTKSDQDKIRDLLKDDQDAKLPLIGVYATGVYSCPHALAHSPLHARHTHAPPLTHPRTTTLAHSATRTGHRTRDPADRGLWLGLVLWPGPPHR